MKKIILGLSFIASVAVVKAQEETKKTEKMIHTEHFQDKAQHYRKGDRRHHPEAKWERMKQELNLSDEQVKKLKKYHEKKQKAREKERENHRKEMKKIFNEEQFKKWEERKKHHFQPKKGEGRPNFHKEGKIGGERP